MQSMMPRVCCICIPGVCVKANYAFNAHLSGANSNMPAWVSICSSALRAVVSLNQQTSRRWIPTFFRCVEGYIVIRSELGYHRAKGSTMNNQCVSLKELGLSDIKPMKEIDGFRVILKGHNYELQPQTKIYRYMRLSTLLDMLFDGTMHISNRNDFTDLREKNGLISIVENLSSFSAVPNYHDRLLMKRLEKDKQRALSVCVSCWTLDRRNENSTDESFLMWKAYSKDDITCRIGTTIGELMESIKKTSSDIVISDVDYKGEIEMTEYEDLIFRKSIYYTDEQEVRMAVLSSNRGGVDIEVNNQILLKEIRISPFIPPVLGYFILSQLKEWCKHYPKVRVEYSKVEEYVETNKKYKRTKESRL